MAVVMSLFSNIMAPYSLEMVSRDDSTEGNVLKETEAILSLNGHFVLCLVRVYYCRDNDVS
jgi:hypothetical protein